MSRGSRRVAFLFLGETLLIPHLYPAMQALAEQEPDLAIDCWVATSVHEDLIAGWLDAAGLAARIRLRRVPGFLRLPGWPAGRNPPLPAKLPMLARLARHLLTARLIMCAEQTSLWIPRVLPFFRRRFIKLAHGAGSMMARSDPRRRAAHRLLVPAPLERERLIDIGVEPERIEVVGYVKASFDSSARTRAAFAEVRPTILYAPHWQAHRSSWWAWGERIVEMLAAQQRFNVILAPHQRLIETAPGLRVTLARVAALPHVHVDLDSFATVDGSYTAQADIYLGDTSSQVVEFLMRPRPCVFLNPQRVAWQDAPDYAFWHCGEVVEDLDRLADALGRADQVHAGFVARQAAFAGEALGDVTGFAAQRAARVISDCLDAVPSLSPLKQGLEVTPPRA